MARLLFAAVLCGTSGLLLGLAELAGARRGRALRVLQRLEDRRLEALRREGPRRWRGRASAAALRALDRLAPAARAGLAGPDTARRLVWADAPLGADQFAALRLLAAAAAALGGAALGAAAGGAGLAVPAGLLGALGGQALPEAVLSAAIRRRHRAIDAELLYFLDFLSVAARGGLSLDSAVEHVGRELPGVLSRALDRVRAEQGMGQWNEHALAGLAERLGHRDVDLVVAALLRAGRFGSPTAQLLQDLAASVRGRRAAAAREHAARAGAAIILPVAVFILPAIVVVLGYPALSTIGGALGGG